MDNISTFYTKYFDFYCLIMYENYLKKKLFDYNCLIVSKYSREINVCIQNKHLNATTENVELIKCVSDDHRLDAFECVFIHKNDNLLTFVAVSP